MDRKQRRKKWTGNVEEVDREELRKIGQRRVLDREEGRKWTGNCGGS